MAASRLEFEQRMETRRSAEGNEDLSALLEDDWCLGSDEFRARMIEQMETKLGENHSGKLIYQSAEARAERIIAEELQRVGWTQADLAVRLKGDPGENGRGQPFAERNDSARDMDRQTPALRHSEECSPSLTQLAAEGTKHPSSKRCGDTDCAEKPWLGFLDLPLDRGRFQPDQV
jgi:hypothetical protein